MADGYAVSSEKIWSDTIGKHKMFKSLTLNNWRQFNDVKIEFHPRLTVLTGANGAGKTTILHLLNRHWGWNIQYVSTPRIGSKHIRRYWAGFWRGTGSLTHEEETTVQHQIGKIEYRDHETATLTIPGKVAETFSVKIEPQPNIAGVYVPSHRPLYLHQKVDQIPTQVDARQQIFEVYLNELRSRFNVNARVQSPSHKLKQSLISLATFGYASQAVTPNKEARETFEGFQNVLRIILPTSLGFRSIRINVPDVLLETATGDFSFDAVSGGVSALIDIAWQVYLYSFLAPEFVVIIDEPENHLHPELQQLILPKLLEAFPKTQFIVATHNPFVVGSVPQSSVFVLRYNNDRKVDSVLLEQVNKAGTADEILREVLGLHSTTAIWVADRLKKIIDRYSQGELNQNVLNSLREELRQIGLEQHVPETLATLIDKTTNNDST